MIRFFNLSLLLFAVSASPAFAVVLENFESGYAGPGTLITDPADATNTALHLVSHRDEPGVLADIFTVNTNGFVGKVTMDIYDFGATISDSGAGVDNGPRWGLQGDADLDGTLDHWVAAGIVQTPFVNANIGYSYIYDDDSQEPFPEQRAFSFNGAWHTVRFFGNPRRVLTDDPGNAEPIPSNGLQLIGGGTFDNPNLPSTGGAWTTWEFDVDAAGKVTMTAKDGTDATDIKFQDAPYEDDVQTQYLPEGLPIEDITITNLKQIWVTGGQSDNDSLGFLGSKFGVHGVLVDNVTFDGVVGSGPNGDYNENGVVDAADYTVYRDSIGAASLPNDAGLGTVGPSHYSLWASNFGAVGSNSTSVPEPSSLALLALVAVGFAGRRGTKVA